MKNPKVMFKIPNYEEVAKNIFWTIKELKENYKEMIFLDLPEEIFQDILRDESFNSVKKKLIDEVKKKHNIKKLRKFKIELKNYWEQFNNLFFENIKKITGFEFYFDKYIIYITEIIRGSYSDENIVYTNPFGIKTSIYITAEEILHIHYWSVYKKIVKNTKFPWKENKKVWEISEMIPEFIFTDDLFKSFGWSKELNRNYPFIEEWKKKLQPLWDNKKNFEDFLKQVHNKFI